MKFKFIISGLAAASLLAACVVASQPVYYAYKANTTNAKKSDDFLNCQVEAANKVPVNQRVGTTPVYTTPVYTTPMYTTCTGYSCVTTGGQVMGGDVYGGDVYSYDANEDLRIQVTLQCMQRKGYTMYDAKTCAPSQVPKGLTASGTDLVQKPSGSFCVARISDSVGIPVAVE